MNKKLLSFFIVVLIGFVFLFFALFQPKADESRQGLNNSKIKAFSSCWKVVLKDKKDNSSIQVSAFDGYSIIKAEQREGLFCVSLKKSTPGTFAAIYFMKDGYIPEIKIVKVSNEPTKTNELVLSPSTDTTKGFIAGVAYRSVSGGKKISHFGIDGFIGALPIKVEGQIVEQLKTDKDGIYKFTLPQGKYLLTTEKGYRAEFIVKSGKTEIVNLFSGQLNVD